MAKIIEKIKNVEKKYVGPKPLPLHFEEIIPKPVDEVFDAVIDSGKLTGYFALNSSGNLIEGNTVTWDFGECGKFDVAVKQIRKNEMIKLEWFVGGVNTNIEIAFTSLDNNSTKIIINETGWTLKEANIKEAIDRAKGWTNFLDCLKAYVVNNVDLREGRLAGALNMQKQIKAA